MGTGLCSSGDHPATTEDQSRAERGEKDRQALFHGLGSGMVESHMQSRAAHGRSQIAFGANQAGKFLTETPSCLASRVTRRGLGWWVANAPT